VLEGRFIVEHATDAREVASEAELLALVFGPDGRTGVRRDDAAEDAWVALWNGDEPHDPQATGMLSAHRGAAGGRRAAGVGRLELRWRPRPSSPWAGWTRQSRCCGKPATR